MPASWLSKGAVSPSIPGTVGLGWRWGGGEAIPQEPQCPLLQTWGGGLQGPEGGSSRASPKITPANPRAAPSPSQGALFPLSEPGMRRSRGVPNPRYQPVPAQLRQYRAATERVVHRWQACGWE